MSKLSPAAQKIEDEVTRRRAAYFSRTGTHGEEMLFSTDAGGSSTGSNGKSAVKVSEAAERCGLSDEAMRERLTGRCRMQVSDGDLIVSQDDLRRLAEDGTIPRPSSVEKARQQSAAAAMPATDSKVENRTTAMADALLIDVAPVIPAETVETEQQPQVQTVTASKRPRRRLGAPRRWGQR